MLQLNKLYKVTKNVGTGLYAGLSYVGSFANPVVDVALVGVRIVAAHGAAGNCGTYRCDTGVFSTTEVNQQADAVGNLYGYPVLHCLADSAWQIRTGMTTAWPPASWQKLDLDAPVKKLVPYDGQLWAITELTAFRITANNAYTAEASMPRTAAAEDLTWMLGHNGKLYLWLGNEVHLFDKAKGEFTPAGLRGRTALGACSVGRWLVVCLTSAATGLGELWGYDGRGWWRIDSEEVSGEKIRWPVGVNGAADDVDVLTGRGNITNQTGLYQCYRRPNSAGLASSYSVTSSLLDANDRDRAKGWRRVGAEFAWPDGRGSADQVTVHVEYSTDGGAVWQSAAMVNVAGNGSRVVSVSGPTIAGTVGRFLQVRVTVSSILDWSPVLLCLWVEAEVLDDVTRRRWRFTVQCKDAVVCRDGSVDTTGARALAARLWALWGSGSTFSMRDVDYDSTGTAYSVRVAGMVEKISKPQDAGTFADGEIELTLAEV